MTFRDVMDMVMMNDPDSVSSQFKWLPDVEAVRWIGSRKKVAVHESVMRVKPH